MAERTISHKTGPARDLVGEVDELCPHERRFRQRSVHLGLVVTSCVSISEIYWVFGDVGRVQVHLAYTRPSLSQDFCLKSSPFSYKPLAALQISLGRCRYTMHIANTKGVSGSCSVQPNNNKK